MLQFHVRDGIPLKRQRIASQEMRPPSITDVEDRLRFGKSLFSEQRMGQSQRRSSEGRLVVALLSHVGKRMLGIAPFPHGHERITKTQQSPVSIERNSGGMGHGLLVKRLCLLERALFEIQIRDPPFCSPSVCRLWMVPQEFFVLHDRVGSGLPRGIITQQELDQKGFRRWDERTVRMFLYDLSKEALRLRPCVLPVRGPTFLPNQCVNPPRLAFLARAVIRQRLHGSFNRYRIPYRGCSFGCCGGRDLRGRRLRNLSDGREGEQHPGGNQE